MACVKSEVGEIPVGVDEQATGTVATFVLGPKATYAAESYLLGLFQLYPTVYYHKATRGAEKLFSNLLRRVFELAKDDRVAETGLSADHPIITFVKNPESLEAAQALDDFAFWGAVESMAGASDRAISKLSLRLRDRKLFKAIEIFTDELIAEARKSDDKDFLNKVAKHLEERLGPEQTTAGSDPKFLWDRLARPLYKEFDKSKGPLNQIVMRMRDNTLRDVAEISPVIEAIGEFEGLRVYIDQDDHATRTKVLEASREAISYARGN
jgi:uncharacterized protein